MTGISPALVVGGLSTAAVKGIQPAMIFISE